MKDQLKSTQNLLKDTQSELKRVQAELSKERQQSNRQAPEGGEVKRSKVEDDLIKLQAKTDMELRKQEQKAKIALDAARQKEAQKSESRSNALSQMAALSGGFGGPMQMQQQHNNMFGMQASGGGGYGGCGGGGFGGYGGGGFGSNMQPFAMQQPQMQQQMQQQQMQQQQMMMQMMQQQMQNPMQKLASSFNGPSANPISAMANPPAYATAPFAHAPAPQPPTTVEQLLQDQNLQQFGQLLNTAPEAGNSVGNNGQTSASALISPRTTAPPVLPPANTENNPTNTNHSAV